MRKLYEFLIVALLIMISATGLIAGCENSGEQKTVRPNIAGETHAEKESADEMVLGGGDVAGYLSDAWGYGVEQSSDLTGKEVMISVATTIVDGFVTHGQDDDTVAPECVPHMILEMVWR